MMNASEVRKMMQNNDRDLEKELQYIEKNIAYAAKKGKSSVYDIFYDEYVESGFDKKITQALENAGYKITRYDLNVISIEW